jgi:hypothetical protein
MPGVELKASVRDGPVVVALRGDLDGTGAADVEAATAALVAPKSQVAVAGLASRRTRYGWRRLAVRTARPGRAAPSRTGTG